MAEDRVHPVKFTKPSWAYTFDESDFVHRYHGDIVVYHDADDVVVLKPGEDYSDHADQLVEKYDVKSGYWWIELGGDWKDIIGQAEEIRYELYKTIYGVWDHIKNVPNNASGRISLWADIVAHHKELEALEAIENFDSSLLTVEQGDTKKSVVVNDAITVVNSMAQLYMTVVVQ